MRRGSGSGGCGWGGGVLSRWSLRRFLLDSPLVGRRLAHTGELFIGCTNQYLRDCGGLLDLLVLISLVRGNMVAM